MENWKVIYDFPNYEISNYGNVRNNTKMVKTVPNKHGYNVVVLCNGTRKSVNVHRLVAAAFIPNPDNKPCVDHIDGNKLNNHVNNLRWCTIGENLKFENVKRVSKLYPVKRIDKLGNIVCFDNILDACVFPWQKYVILQVCNGKRKTYNGYKWEHNDPAISGK